LLFFFHLENLTSNNTGTQIHPASPPPPPLANPTSCKTIIFPHCDKIGYSAE
jgi:hypothetical protein